MVQKRWRGTFGDFFLDNLVQLIELHGKTIYKPVFMQKAIEKYAKCANFEHDFLNEKV